MTEYMATDLTNSTILQVSMHFIIVLIANLCIFQACLHARGQLVKFVLSVQTIACQFVGCFMCFGYDKVYVKLVQRLREIAEISGSLTEASKESLTGFAQGTYLITTPLLIVFLSFLVVHLAILWGNDNK